MWLRAIFALLFSLVVVNESTPQVAAQAAAEALVISAGPCLENPTPDSISVMWMTNRNSTGWIEYGPAGGSLQKAVGSHHGLINANERIHRVTLSGLRPGVRYRYRVSSRDILDFGPNKVQFGETVSSETAEFQTLDRTTAALSFLVFNDIHEDRSTLPQMLAAAGDKPYELVFFNGDILSHFEQERQIADLLGDMSRQFATRIPFVWVRGNHETRGSLARRLPNYLDLPEGRYYFSFDYGPVHFVVLDTGEDKEDSHVEYSGLVDFDAYRREQAEWLQREIRTDAFRQAKFRVVLAHMPFPEATTGPSHGMNADFDQFGALLNQGKVDMMISGHIHRWAIDQPVEGRNNYPIVRGGGPSQQSRTVIRVEARGDRLHATILGPDGAVLGSTEVTARD